MSLIYNVTCCTLQDKALQRPRWQCARLAPLSFDCLLKHVLRAQPFHIKLNRGFFYPRNLPMKRRFTDVLVAHAKYSRKYKLKRRDVPQDKHGTLMGKSMNIMYKFVFGWWEGTQSRNQMN
jgi:hypothetical protein